MTTEYNVLILETDSFEPKSWSDNPNDGKLFRCVEQTELKVAREIARGFNEEVLSNKDNLWAVVVPAGDYVSKQGQTVHVEGNHLLN